MYHLLRGEEGGVVGGDVRSDGGHLLAELVRHHLQHERGARGRLARRAHLLHQRRRLRQPIRDRAQGDESSRGRHERANPKGRRRKRGPHLLPRPCAGNPVRLGGAEQQPDGGRVLAQVAQQLRLARVARRGADSVRGLRADTKTKPLVSLFVHIASGDNTKKKNTLPCQASRLRCKHRAGQLGSGTRLGRSWTAGVWDPSR
eukprot:1189690-Prorocentrum_minimum.AAC.3